MKKLLLTALAIVTISATSFGKNDVKIKKLEKKSMVFFNCMQDQEATYDLYISHGASHYESYFAGAGAWGSCMRG